MPKSREGDLIVEELVTLNQRSSKSLQSEYGPKNLRRMGEHGFIVDDSPRPPKTSTSRKPKGGA
ncbi:MAG: hypothetical protein H7330_04475 [Hymenobacteraceae bacterium]|nr:hypothetical protein [Hymenobacteraceae bacterium]